MGLAQSLGHHHMDKDMDRTVGGEGWGDLGGGGAGGAGALSFSHYFVCMIM